MSRSRQPRPRVTRRAFLALGAAAVTGAPAAAQQEQSSAVKPSSLAEAQLQAILARHGDRLTPGQKADLKRLLARIPETSAVLHAFPLEENSDPALIFRVYRADRR